MSERRRPDPLRMLGWAVFFAMLLWTAQSFFQCTSSPLVGQPAPDFEAPIVAGDGAGDRVALASLRGRPVLLDNGDTERGFRSQANLVGCPVVVCVRSIPS